MLEVKCVRRPCLVEEGVVETIWDELMQFPFLITLHYCREGGRENCEVDSEKN